ncbi:MAG: N-acetylneuraminate synthase family protein [Gammaproteobacteria bacterium]|nr:N-acetylneuraminate synthase family protein [Gammaproteobacteria bacterium]
MRVSLTRSKEVFNFCEPYVIAEIGANHNGDMDLAKELIKQAKKAGADCVKFQSWSKESIFSRSKYEKNYFLQDDYRGRSDTNLEQIVEKYSMSEQELLSMKEYADSVGIDFTSTPFSIREVDFLVEILKAPFIKVASMDLNNYPFLKYISQKKLPIILSTGLSELYQIDRAVKTIEEQGNTNIVILHCVSIYPPEDSQVNLNNITTLQTVYPSYPVGFSDHSLGSPIPLASVTKGACVIEKHFTLDKGMEGWDHKVSADFDELQQICFESKRIYRALGSARIDAVENTERKNEFRRSIVLTRSMSRGEVIKGTDLDFKRPGTGLPPEMYEMVVGLTLTKDKEEDSILTKDDFI